MGRVAEVDGPEQNHFSSWGDQAKTAVWIAAFPGTAPQPYFWNAVSTAAEKVEAN